MRGKQSQIPRYPDELRKEERKGMWQTCKSRWKAQSELCRVVVSFAACLSVGCAFTSKVGNITFTAGPSMEPTLHTDGGIVVVDIWSYSKPEWLCGWLGCRRMSYKPGDVVICRHPYDEDKSESHPSVPCPMPCMLC